ncbi:hypothetical protein FBQ80_17350 [Candidatus Brocadia sp. AMX2]|uniref:hypothetical protein n=1 Tax=Candidatus Brocadia TaxID=380240 RepID=UPI0012FF2ED1|nr:MULTISPECIES: hypothetical protein [Brocadia]MCK6467658.1 hypothetical protein [Candidatus Brocadia sinica]MDL1937293.1 hypothetical protein [Candidatus Brocadia sp. AMX2]NOG40429.1 hypothetical protein [Planctomycetota bacterium]NUO06609.1 hypothetical protein [Candidatus Brocadia sinica]
MRIYKRDSRGRLSGSESTTSKRCRRVGARDGTLIHLTHRAISIQHPLRVTRKKSAATSRLVSKLYWKRNCP